MWDNKKLAIPNKNRRFVLESRKTSPTQLSASAVNIMRPYDDEVAPSCIATKTNAELAMILKILRSLGQSYNSATTSKMEVTRQTIIVISVPAAIDP